MKRIAIESLLEQIYWIQKNKRLVKGLKPAQFAPNRAVTQKQWEHSLRPEKEDPNPIKLGFQFVQYLKEHPNSTYDELAAMSGVSKARICQIVALHKRLPAPITDYLMNNDEPEVLKYFIERKLRPLTLLASDDEKLRKFEEMKKARCEFLN
jgi:hypothetical protein